ncbi:MAG TPA: hypothetical protein DDX91_01630, partial [Ruminococcaceae bacterium]|nr:hypothetical protein [Oscillospiraceae bacterium]
MNMKKIVASALASVMAVSTMAIAASAEALLTRVGQEGDGKYVVDLSDLTEDQVKSIAKVEADLSVDTTLVNGVIGYNSASKGAWDGETGKYEFSDDNGGAKGTAVLEIADGDLAAKDADGALAPYMEVQIWWVQPQYDEEGNESGSGTASLSYVGLFDKDGNVVKEFGERAAVAPPATEPEGTAAEGTAAEGTTGAQGDVNKPSTDKGQPNTGV